MFFQVAFINFFISNFGAVIELTDKTFEATIKDKNTFVMFYSPNCGHCQRLKPTYESLSSRVAIKNSGVLIAKVDCTDKGRDTCGKYNVNGFPTLKFFNTNDGKDKPADYDGNRELNDLEQFVLNNNRDAIIEISDSEFNEFIFSKTLPVIIAFVSDEKSRILSVLKSLAPLYKKNYLFGYTFSKQKAKELGHKMDTMHFYRQIQYKSKLEDYVITINSEKDLPRFLAMNQYSLVEYRTNKNVDYFKPPHITCFIKFDPFLKKSTAKRLRNIILKQAKKLEKYKFSISLADDFGEFVSEIAPDSGDLDLVLMGVDISDKKFIGPKFGNYEDPRAFEKILEEFIRDFSAGNVLKQYIKSQPADTPDDGFVKVVTALNFKEIVLDSKEDVLIEFYAPWCGHCKKLAPIYQQLATSLKDEPNLVIAKYDATANEQQKGYEIQGFPTIFLAKAGKKTAPIQFNGNRDAQSMLDFIKQNAKHPIKFDGKISEVKEEL